jgi:hypothetical protein
MRTLSSTALAILLCALPGVALAEEAPPAAAGTTPAPTTPAPTETALPPTESVATPAPAAETPDRGAFVVGGLVGAIFPFDGLSPFVVGGVELGYILPWLSRSFAILADVEYSEPRQSGTTANDPRVDGSTYNWHITQRELTIAPTVLFRVTRFGRMVPFIGVGPRIYLLESLVDGTVGSTAIATTTEQSTKVGVTVPIGVEVKLGPGALLGEFLFEYGPLNHTATGDSTTTMGGTIQVGYRFML